MLMTMQSMHVIDLWKSERIKANAQHKDWQSYIFFIQFLAFYSAWQEIHGPAGLEAGFGVPFVAPFSDSG